MRRNVPAFSHAQTERLIALNRQLTKLEYWCLQREKSLSKTSETDLPPLTGLQRRTSSLKAKFASTVLSPRHKGKKN